MKTIRDLSEMHFIVFTSPAVVAGSASYAVAVILAFTRIVLLRLSLGRRLAQRANVANRWR